MPNEVENYATELTKRPKGVLWLDITDGVTPESIKMRASLLEDVLAEYIGLDCQVGNEGTVSMTLVVDAGVKMCPKNISIWNTAGGKGSQDIQLKIGSSSGGDDIMPLTTLIGFFQDATWPVTLMGVMPEMLSDVNTYYLTLVTGSSGANVVDVRVHGNQFDV